MSYVMKLMGGNEYEITNEEFQKLNGKTGLIHIPSLDVVVNLASVTTIEPKGKFTKQVDRTKQLEGVLSDGSRVIKQFGRWFLADGSRDENGKLEVEPNPHFYPELVLGILPTPQDFAELGHLAFENIKLLNNSERPVFQLGERQSEDGLSKV